MKRYIILFIVPVFREHLASAHKSRFCRQSPLLPGFTCAAVVRLPQSKPLIFGQQVGEQFVESMQKLVQEQDCLGSSLWCQNTEPKCLLKRQGLWKLTRHRLLHTSSSTMEIPLGSYWTCHTKQLPKAHSNSKNVIFFLILCFILLLLSFNSLRPLHPPKMILRTRNYFIKEITLVIEFHCFHMQMPVGVYYSGRKIQYFILLRIYINFQQKIVLQQSIAAKMPEGTLVDSAQTLLKKLKKGK